MNNELTYIPPEEVTGLDLVDVALEYLIEELEKLEPEEKAICILDIIEKLENLLTDEKD